MADELASPNVLNYAVLKGIVHFTPEGGVRRDLGNCTQFDFEPAVETLDHFSSRTGVRSKDFSVTLEKSATVTITLDEITLKNLQMALMGGTISAGDGTTEGGDNAGFDIFAESEVRGVLELTGTNDVGPRYNIRLPSVSFKPGGAIPFIGDDWAAIELSGEVLAVDGSFGRVWLQDSNPTTEPPTTEPPTTE